jgi:hypothetical protein
MIVGNSNDIASGLLARAEKFAISQSQCCKWLESSNSPHYPFFFAIAPSTNT